VPGRQVPLEYALGESPAVVGGVSCASLLFSFYVAKRKPTLGCRCCVLQSAAARGVLQCCNCSAACCMLGAPRSGWVVMSTLQWPACIGGRLHVLVSTLRYPILVSTLRYPSLLAAQTAAVSANAATQPCNNASVATLPGRGWHGHPSATRNAARCTAQQQFARFRRQSHLYYRQSRMRLAVACEWRVGVPPSCRRQRTASDARCMLHGVHTVHGAPMLRTSAPGIGSFLPRLRRDWAHSCHVCAGTGLIPATSAPGLGSSPARCGWTGPTPLGGGAGVCGAWCVRTEGRVLEYSRQGVRVEKGHSSTHGGAGARGAGAGGRHAHGRRTADRDQRDRTQ
jgi:hypothetical protein